MSRQHALDSAQTFFQLHGFDYRKFDLAAIEAFNDVTYVTIYDNDEDYEVTIFDAQGEMLEYKRHLTIEDALSYFETFLANCMYY